MFHANRDPAYRAGLAAADADRLGAGGLDEVRDFLRFAGSPEPTPLVDLPGAARAHGIGSLRIKDEAGRLGLGSFKALGGAFALAQLVREAAALRLGRPVAFDELDRPEVRDVEVDAVGELCTPRDVLTRGQAVDRLRVGDVLVFARTGGYGWDISHHEFLRHPHPEVLVI